LSVIHEGGPKERKSVERRDELRIVSMTLQDGEDLIVGRRLREILNLARKNAEGKKV
jgi:hypothetical protein